MHQDIGVPRRPVEPRGHRNLRSVLVPADRPMGRKYALGDG